MTRAPSMPLVSPLHAHTHPSFNTSADGSFSGDMWGEVDTRFSYCALSGCSILGRLDALNLPAAVAFILACRNFDGGFGCVPGAESHAGQVFCCIGALSIAGACLLHAIVCTSQIRIPRPLLIFK